MKLFLNGPVDFFEWLWRSSWQASVLVLLIFFVQWTFSSRLSPRWNYLLWLLVVLRLLWPGSVESPASIFNLVQPAMILGVSGKGEENPSYRSASDPREGLVARGSIDSAIVNNLSGLPAQRTSFEKTGSFFGKSIWLAGSVVLLTGIIVSAGRMSRRIRRERPVTNSTMLDLLQDCKEEMGVHTPLTLIETREVESPVLYGFMRPRLLLPVGLQKRFSQAEMRHVFLHELSHLKRGDIQLNWVSTLLLVLHWFNPFVWFAVNRMRVDRELACDALALSYSKEQKSYGETILKLVEQFSRPAWGPAIVGIVEDKNQIKRRIKMILKFKHAKHWSALAAALFAGLGLITLTEAQSPQTAVKNSDKPDRVPRIIATVPAIGATDVDPALTEITVNFDLDMAGGFSWTGGGSDYPAREGEKPRWRDKRTCVLPVKLEAAHYYRVGINSPSHQNFRSVAGTSAIPTAFYFTTKGASDEVKAKAKKPEIVELNPPNGAKDVDSNTKELRVTFNVPMAGGFSWTGSGPQFPAAPEVSLEDTENITRQGLVQAQTDLSKARAEAAQATQVVAEIEEKLKAGATLDTVLEVANNPTVQRLKQEIAIQDANWEALKKRYRDKHPTIIQATEQLARMRESLDDETRTVFESLRNAAIIASARQQSLEAVVAEEQKKQRNLNQLRIQNDVLKQGKRPYWTSDKKTCIMPVELKPGIDYQVELNSVSHKNFQSADGIPLDPIAYRFQTKAAP